MDDTANHIHYSENKRKSRWAIMIITTLVILNLLLLSFFSFGGKKQKGALYTTLKANMRQQKKEERICDCKLFDSAPIESDPNARIFPLPQRISIGSSSTKLSNLISFVVKYPESMDNDFLKQVIEHQCSIIGTVITPNSNQQDQPSSSNTIRNINIDIDTSTDAKPNEYPQYPMNEDYEITINSNNIIIKSQTIYGSMRGMESFIQFTTPINTPIPYPTTITDSPRFKWRGLLLDSSRHYYPINYIKKVIDGLSYNKYNTLHWHITDAISFPLDIPKYPDLAKKASFNGQIYKEEDIKELVSYAKIRGIRIVPEVDSPAHTAALYKYDKDMIITCNEPNFDDFSEVNKYIINPTNPKTIKLIEDIYDYISSLFPDRYFHLGGDEIDITYWNCDDKINKYAQQKGITVEKVLQNYLVHISEYVQNKNKIVLFWEGAFESGASLNKFVCKESWKCWSNLGYDSFAQSVKSGRQSLQASCNYLDFNAVWPEYYNHDIIKTVTISLLDEKSPFILGGEAAVWSERIDITTLEYRIWPRASAVLETLWRKQSDSVSDALKRLNIWSEKLRRRGIMVAPFSKDSIPSTSESKSNDGYSGMIVEANYDSYPPPVSQKTQRNTTDINTSIMIFDVQHIRQNKDNFEKLILSTLPTYLFLYDTMVTDPSFVEFASSVGYAYSHIMRGDKSLAILSSNPFLIVKAVKDQFDYGYIHIKVGDLNFISVHLSDKGISKQIQEIDDILKYTETFTSEKIILLGVFNSLSQADKDKHQTVVNTNEGNMFVNNGVVNYDVINRIISKQFKDISMNLDTFTLSDKSKVRSDFIFVNSVMRFDQEPKCNSKPVEFDISKHIPFICSYK